MKTTLGRWLGIGLAAAVMAGSPAAAQSVDGRLATQAFMHQKLPYTQGILEGLALERFDLISRNALLLRNMSVSNLWTRVGQPDYKRNTAAFKADVDAIYKAAAGQDLKGATEAYARMARSCVECHRLVRRDQHLKTIQQEK